MSLILNIDTTAETALVNIARDGVVLFESMNETQNDHATFLHPAIISLFEKAAIKINDIDAIAVSHGPGSYTGIRVGVAAAKGLCYATNKPLITVNQLEILTNDAIENNAGHKGLFCPMIDAKRMEVFTGVYNNRLEELMPPSALVLQHESFHDFLAAGKILFFGTGAAKWQQVCTQENACFTTILNKGLAFAKLSIKLHQRQQFDDLAYSSPLYIKDFYTTAVAR